MGGYELFDILAANRELISDTWHYFLTVHLAIFGIVYIASGRIGVGERILLVFAYFGFMFMNYGAQVDNYENYQRLTDAIRALPAPGPELVDVRELIADADVWVVDVLHYVYLAAGAVGALIILLINRGRGADD
ncbi:MAG: hypothetical protein ACFB00_12065 [Parvularculaceae bacterium]